MNTLHFKSGPWRVVYLLGRELRNRKNALARTAVLLLELFFVLFSISANHEHPQALERRTETLTDHFAADSLVARDRRLCCVTRVTKCFFTVSVK